LTETGDTHEKIIVGEMLKMISMDFRGKQGQFNWDANEKSKRKLKSRGKRILRENKAS